MASINTEHLDKIRKAFIGHGLVSIRKTDGHLLEPGYIVIMYGDVGFRMQPAQKGHESYFVRTSEIAEIRMVEPEISPA